MNVASAMKAASRDITIHSVATRPWSDIISYF
jgi:hypothetical protein